jgi:hypothetical protein
MILKNMSAKKLAFLTLNKAKLCKNLVITLVFEKNANFFAERRNFGTWENVPDLFQTDKIFIRTYLSKFE